MNESKVIFPIGNIQDLRLVTGLVMMKAFGKNDCFRTITFYPNGTVENGSMHIEYWGNPNMKIEPFSILQVNNRFYSFTIDNQITFRQLLDFGRDNCIDVIVDSEALLLNKQDDKVPKL